MQDSRRSLPRRTICIRSRGCCQRQQCGRIHRRGSHQCCERYGDDLEASVSCREGAAWKPATVKYFPLRCFLYPRACPCSCSCTSYALRCSGAKMFLPVFSFCCSFISFGLFLKKSIEHLCMPKTLL